jgi:hypothetical protein
MHPWFVIHVTWSAVKCLYISNKNSELLVFTVHDYSLDLIFRKNQYTLNRNGQRQTKK